MRPKCWILRWSGILGIICLFCEIRLVSTMEFEPDNPLLFFHGFPESDYNSWEYPSDNGNYHLGTTHQFGKRFRLRGIKIPKGKKSNSAHFHEDQPSKRHYLTESNGKPDQTSIKRRPRPPMRFRFKPTFIGKRHQNANNMNYRRLQMGKRETYLQYRPSMLGKRGRTRFRRPVMGSRGINRFSIGKGKRPGAKAKYRLISKRKFMLLRTVMGKRMLDRFKPTLMGKRIFDRFKPNLMGKRMFERGKPTLIGKRMFDRFKPTFIGKRTFERFKPNFIGKRMFERSKPTLIGKRMFDRYKPTFMGKQKLKKWQPTLMKRFGFRANWEPQYIGKQIQNENMVKQVHAEVKREKKVHPSAMRQTESTNSSEPMMPDKKFGDMEMIENIMHHGAK